jgi:hypothetical protein
MIHVVILINLTGSRGGSEGLERGTWMRSYTLSGRKEEERIDRETKERSGNLCDRSDKAIDRIRLRTKRKN